MTLFWQWLYYDFLFFISTITVTLKLFWLFLSDLWNEIFWVIRFWDFMTFVSSKKTQLNYFNVTFVLTDSLPHTICSTCTWKELDCFLTSMLSNIEKKNYYFPILSLIFNLLELFCFSNIQNIRSKYYWIRRERMFYYKFLQKFGRSDLCIQH